MTDLIKLAERYKQIKEDLLHGGYSGEFQDNHILKVITDEILTDELSSEDLKRVMINLFFLGQISTIEK